MNTTTPNDSTPMLKPDRLAQMVEHALGYEQGHTPRPQPWYTKVPVLAGSFAALLLIVAGSYMAIAPMGNPDLLDTGLMAETTDLPDMIIYELLEDLA